MRLSEPIPDESTILHFRHLLGIEHGILGQGLFTEIEDEQPWRPKVLRLRVQRQSIVDANHHRGAVLDQEPDRAAGPGDAPGEEGEPRAIVGMKLAVIGVDSETGLECISFATIHQANVHRRDTGPSPALLHGGERQVWGDAGYVGVQKREEHPGVGGTVAGGT